MLLVARLSASEVELTQLSTLQQYPARPPQLQIKWQLSALLGCANAGTPHVGAVLIVWEMSSCRAACATRIRLLQQGLHRADDNRKARLRASDLFELGRKGSALQLEDGLMPHTLHHAAPPANSDTTNQADASAELESPPFRPCLPHAVLYSLQVKFFGSVVSRTFGVHSGQMRIRTAKKRYKADNILDDLLLNPTEHSSLARG